MPMASENQITLLGASRKLVARIRRVKYYKVNLKCISFFCIFLLASKVLLGIHTCRGIIYLASHHNLLCIFMPPYRRCRRHYVFGLSVRPSGCPSRFFRLRNNSSITWWNFIKLGQKVKLDVTINWLHFEWDCVAGGGGGGANGGLAPLFN